MARLTDFNSLLDKLSIADGISTSCDLVRKGEFV